MSHRSRSKQTSRGRAMSDRNFRHVWARDGDLRYHLCKECPTMADGGYGRISRLNSAKRSLRLCDWCREEVRSV